MQTQEMPAQGVRVQGAPRLSVIMPVYNAEETLAEAVDSVLGQSLEDLELVCVDDGSTDGSAAILREYEAKDPRVRVLTQPHQNAGPARNAGLEAASGEYVHFLDADDRVLPYAYECLYDKAKKHDLDVLRCAGVDWDVGRGCYVEKALEGLSKLQPGDFGRLVGAEEGSPVYKASVTPWAGISRRAFLMERGIRFNGLVCVNDRSFFAAEVTNARRMMYSRDRVVFHRDAQAGSLVGKRARHFDCHFRSIELIVSRMESDGVDPEVRRRVLEREFDDLFFWYRKFVGDPAYGDAIEEQTAAFVEGYEGPFGWRLRAKLRDAKRQVQRQGGATPANDREVKVEHAACEVPKVSVVVPVYNVEDYLNEALDSLVNQTLEEMEFICVNDGSTDGSLAILKEYAALDKRIRILDGPNGGYGRAMNRGIDAARGEYLGILEPDDFVPREMYAELYERARKADADLVKADFYRFTTGPAGKLHKELFRLSGNKSYYNRVLCPGDEQQVFRFPMNTWSGIYRLEFLNRWHIRHNETLGASYQDNGFFFQTFCRAERALFVDKAYYMNRRDNPGSSVSNPGKLYAVTEEYAFIERWLKQDPALWERYSNIFYFQKFSNFLVTFGRIAGGLQREYLHHFADEFEGPLEQGLIDEELFGDAWMWRLREIVEDPDAFADHVRVSVVMPVYNGERYLRQAIDSALGCNYIPVELICVDDGSTDASPEILAEYAARDPRVRVVTQRNAGPGAARNAGMRIARGDYLTSLDADDIFKPNMLGKVYDKARSNEADIVVFGCDQYLEEKGEYNSISWALKKGALPVSQPFAGSEIDYNIFDAFMGWTWDKLFRADFVRENGLEFQELRNTDDMLFTFSAIVKAERIVTMDEALVHHRVYAGSVSTTRENSWWCFHDALLALRRQLEDWDLFERREQDFVNYALNFSLWHLNSLTGDAYYELYDALKHGWLEDLGILGRPADYFYKASDYEQLQALLAGTPDEFLFWRINRTVNQRDDLSRQLTGARNDLKREQAGARKLASSNRKLTSSNRKLTSSNKKLEAKVRVQQSEIDELRSSTAWKVGRFITWIPRKVKGWLLARRRKR